MKTRKNIFLKAYMALFICLTVLIIPVFIPGAAFSDEANMKEPAALWPAETAGWKITEGPTLYDTTTAYTYMNGAAELFIAFNMQTLTVIKYEKEGQPPVTLEIYKMASSADAYGIFSFESDDPKGSIGQGSEFGGGLLRFWKGKYFVSVYGDAPGESVEAATLGLGESVASAIREKGEPPKMLVLLPARLEKSEKKQAWFLRSHVLLNQRFFIAYDNILKLSADVEAALGQYSCEKEKAYLLIIKYPSQTRTDEAFNSFRKAFMAETPKGNSVRTENNRWTVIEIYGNYLAVAFDATDEQSAIQMLKLSAVRIKEGK
jgi:hypothetical protein